MSEIITKVQEQEKWKQVEDSIRRIHDSVLADKDRLHNAMIINNAIAVVSQLAPACGLSNQLDFLSKLTNEEVIQVRNASLGLLDSTFILLSLLRDISYKYDMVTLEEEAVLKAI